jgi:hypothetical protein
MFEFDNMNMKTPAERLISSLAHDERTKWMLDDYVWKAILKTTLLDESNQRQEDTNNGYAQGYDDAAQGKEPMRPEIRNAEKQSYQDKMRDKVTKAKSRLK